MTKIYDVRDKIANDDKANCPDIKHSQYLE